MNSFANSTRIAEYLLYGDAERIPPEAGSEKRTGEGADRKGQALPETGAGYEPAVGGGNSRIIQ